MGGGDPPGWRRGRARPEPLPEGREPQRLARSGRPTRAESIRDRRPAGRAAAGSPSRGRMPSKSHQCEDPRGRSAPDSVCTGDSAAGRPGFPRMTADDRRAPPFRTSALPALLSALAIARKCLSSLTFRTSALSAPAFAGIDDPASVPALMSLPGAASGGGAERDDDPTARDRRRWFVRHCMTEREAFKGWIELAVLMTLAERRHPPQATPRPHRRHERTRRAAAASRPRSWRTWTRDTRPFPVQGAEVQATP